jgi:hypothetical protein
VTPFPPLTVEDTVAQKITHEGFLSLHVQKKVNRNNSMYALYPFFGLKQSVKSLLKGKAEK